jgi:DNA-binding MarR family transcriptional regulator
VAQASPDRAEDLLMEISELYAIVLRIARRVHDDEEPMTVTQRLALIEVVAVGPLRLGQLASRMDTTPATATRAVDVLEEAGLVKRRPDPGDRRGTAVEATAKGRRWAERRGAVLREVLQALPPNAAPARLVVDMARLNEALRTSTGHDEIARGALLAR